MAAPKKVVIAGVSIETQDRLVADNPGAHYVPTEHDGDLVLLPWTPYGRGYEIPLIFGARDSEPFEWEFLVLVIRGAPQCVSLNCWALDPDNPVTATAIHEFRLGEKIEAAAVMAARPIDEVPRRARRWDDLEAARAEQAIPLRHHKRRRRPRTKLTDEFLAEVARVYRANMPTGRPSKAVAEHFSYAAGSARRVVSEARARGFLGQALDEGRSGEQVPKTRNTRGGRP